MARPYQKANIPGPEIGSAVSDPLVIANIIKNSSKVLLLIGAEAYKKVIGENKTYADYLVNLGKKVNADIVATGATFKYLSEKGIEGIILMPVINVTDRLTDPNWKNIKGDGEKYDLVITGGFLIYYISQMLATLKNKAQTLRTLSLDRYHQPNARFSLPNLEKQEWIEILEEIEGNL